MTITPTLLHCMERLTSKDHRLAVMRELLTGLPFRETLIPNSHFKRVSTLGTIEKLGHCGSNMMLAPMNMNYVSKLIVAHYDRVAVSPGANDNGAAVAAVIAASFNAWHNQSNTLVVFTDLEEPENCSKVMAPMAAGADYLKHQLDTMGINPDWKLVLDVCGDGENLLISQGQAGKKSLCEWLEQQAQATELGLVYKRTPCSDNIALGREDTTLISTISTADMDMRYPKAWHKLHTSRDSLESVNMDTIGKVSRIVEAFIRA